MPERLAPLRLALAQINPRVGDLEGNAAKIRDRIERGARRRRRARPVPGARAHRLPARGPAAQGALPARERARRSTELAAGVEGIVAIVGYPERTEDVYNSIAVIADGAVRAIYRKMRLPNYGVSDEERYFQAGAGRRGDRPRRRAHRAHGLRGHVGAGPARVRRGQAGASLIVNLSASPYHAGKGAAARADARSSARATTSPRSRSATWSAARTSSSSTATRS